MDGKQPQDITFKSKIGTSLIFAMAVPILFALVAFSLTKGPGFVVLASCLPLCGVEGLFVRMLTKTSYCLSGSRLRIKSVDYEIDLAISEILAVRPSRDPRSSPALSLDRIDINFIHEGRKASVLISPKKRNEFLVELQNRDSGLILVQDSLVRDPLSCSPNERLA